MGDQLEKITSSGSITTLADLRDESKQYQPAELLLAAEILENIVAEGTLIGLRRLRGTSDASLSQLWSSSLSLLSDGKDDAQRDQVTLGTDERVLRLVYGAMKYLQFTDTILVKTQFLVYNNQFLNHLGLVKIMIYDLMKYHFDYSRYPGIKYHPIPTDLPEVDPASGVPSVVIIESMNDMVRDLSIALHNHRVKLAAAFARIRIERKAAGRTIEEQVQNILPEEVRLKESIAVEMPKSYRVNMLRTTPNAVINELISSGFPVCSNHTGSIRPGIPPPCIEVDPDFQDLLIIPQDCYPNLKSHPLVLDGKLIFQDKASLYAAKHLEADLATQPPPKKKKKKIVVTEEVGENVNVLEKEVTGPIVIDARAGCGVRASYLSALMGNRGKIYAFENRTSRLESLKARLNVQAVNSLSKKVVDEDVEIIEEDFLSIDQNDPKFSNGPAIMDRLGFLLQEEEFPNDQYSNTDLISLKRGQLSFLRTAFKFSKVKTVVYITRSIHRQENEEVIEEAMDRFGREHWKLTCVLPDIVSEEQHEYEECLTIRPTPESGNGVFVGAFTRTSFGPNQSHDWIASISTAVSDESDEEEDDAGDELSSSDERPEKTTMRQRIKKHVNGQREEGVRRRRNAKSDSNLEDGKDDDEVVEKKTAKVKKVKKPVGLRQLPKRISESVTRLSVPRGGVVKKLGGAGSKKEERTGAETDENGEEGCEKEDNERTDAESEGENPRSACESKGKQKSQESGLGEEVEGLEVYGLSIDRFYAPKTAALRHLESRGELEGKEISAKEDEENVPVWKRLFLNPKKYLPDIPAWRYPVRRNAAPIEKDRKRNTADPFKRKPTGPQSPAVEMTTAQ
ncbi:hypothetical protein BJ742DRAFT_854100 [Cladochytrium replicatum]|nr:hypothetical protein BJ742DRAFT_854100 [Cladochytrium replicatum]